MAPVSTAEAGAVAEAMERVQRMSTVAGDITRGNIQSERMGAALASTTPIKASEFKTFSAMLWDSRVDELGVLVFDRGNEHLADRVGVTERNVQKHIASLKGAGFLVPVRYGGWYGDDLVTGKWGFSTPEESDPGDIYTLAERWWTARGSTAAALHRHDLVAGMRRLYGDDVIVPEHLPGDVTSLGDVPAFVDYMRLVHRR